MWWSSQNQIQPPYRLTLQQTLFKIDLNDIQKIEFKSSRYLEERGQEKHEAIDKM